MSDKLVFKEHTNFFYRCDWTFYVKLSSKRYIDALPVGELFSRRLAEFVVSENSRPKKDGSLIEVVGGELITKMYSRRPRGIFENKNHSEKPS